MSKSKKEMEVEMEDGIGYNQLPPDNIFTYNELRSCSDLFSLYKKGILNIHPEFQRNEVWPETYQTRFIDSLLKEMPISNMCFSYDKKKNSMRVIDGLQRITSIIKFLDIEYEWKLKELPDIDPRISGKTNIDIRINEINVFDNISNLSIPVTVLRTDEDNIEHNEYIFEIFHRLNTYGKKLNNQEIRNCIYSGEFNYLIKELNTYDGWKSLMNFSNDIRFLRVELILRFFAFFDTHSEYNNLLTRFLNDYMSLHRNDDKKTLEKKKLLFIETVDLINQKIAPTMDSKKISNVFIDALLFGVASNLKTLKNKSDKEIQQYFSKFKNQKELREEYISEGTMRKDKVLSRLNKSKEIFSGKLSNERP